MAPKVCFLAAVRRRTMICCRNVKISASSAARDRNRSTTAQTMSLKRSLITDQHRPILGQPPAIRLATGTGDGDRPAMCGHSLDQHGQDVARIALPIAAVDKDEARCRLVAGRVELDL